MAYCCNYMKAQLEMDCGSHDQWRCPDRLIHRKASVYGIIIHDGGESYDRILYCPWCGAELRKFPEPLGSA